jgi:quinohemoprotein ethanol dehydrogenase
VSRALPLLALLATLGCGEARLVDDAALSHVEKRPGEWLSHGRDYAEQRHSPLAQIDEHNVEGLGLAWSFDTGTDRGLEATPLVVDGVLYTTGSWSVVFALDARTGALLWKWDPQVDRRYDEVACCDVVNRGVAFYEGRVYVGVLDGRLTALDAKTGEPLWETVTVDQTKPYTITGAPRVVKGKVIIGNGGAELGVRGYVSAYDAGTGALDWRFHTVPGDPSLPFESEAMARAAETWSGGEWWRYGGGGTAWDSMAFDPELDLLYVGTGNGSPWTRHIRSPGGGDNLYLSAILALDPDDGRLVWHYQTTPGDNWDYTSTQHMILADLEVAGRHRKTILQAPKNGFFYVLDRETGELLSAEPYAEVTWAERIDPKTGRPVEAAGADYREGGAYITPSPSGGHNWQPMSFNPQTGLVYIPTQDRASYFHLAEDFEHRPGRWNTGVRRSGFPDELLAREWPHTGYLLAWDPVLQKERWRVRFENFWNGGTLTTAGNLVFHGTAAGDFAAYRASDGERLWQAWLGTGILAAPISYRVDDVQYVSIMAGWGGGPVRRFRNPGRLYTFALGGEAGLPERPRQPEVAALHYTATQETLVRGAGLFRAYCGRCHGGGTTIADLRYSPEGVFDLYREILHDGILSNVGMRPFRQLSEGDIEAIRVHVLAERQKIATLPAAGEISRPAH